MRDSCWFLTSRPPRISMASTSGHAVTRFRSRQDCPPLAVTKTSCWSIAWACWRDIAYVGGGFGRAGLHSVLEPAAWGLPVIFGPNWQSSREAGLLLEAGGGISLDSADRLAEVWARWLEDDSARHDAGQAALRVVRSGLGGADLNAKLVEAAIEGKDPD